MLLILNHVIIMVLLALIVILHGGPPDDENCMEMVTGLYEYVKKIGYCWCMTRYDIVHYRIECVER